MDNKKVIVYGAYGYTGDLIVQRCIETGLKPLLSGRNEQKLKAIAEKYNLTYLACDLNSPVELDGLLSGASVIIHSAGPFIHTCKPMVEACIRNKVHYTDITGEINVFHRIHSYDKQAKKNDVMLLPGTGFDVVPSDCLAAHLKSRLAEADDLVLAFYSLGKMSRGTSLTMVEGMGYGGMLRKDGKLKFVPDAHDSKKINFDGKNLSAATIPWGDVYTAYFSTGIPNIKVYMAMSRKMIMSVKMARYLGRLLRSKWFKNRLRKKIHSGKPGPTDMEREKNFAVLTGTATAKNGNSVTSSIKTQDGYTLTAMTAVYIARQILKGKFKPGFQTPSLAYGKNIITEVSGAQFINY